MVNLFIFFLPIFKSMNLFILQAKMVRDFHYAFISHISDWQRTRPCSLLWKFIKLHQIMICMDVFTVTAFCLFKIIQSSPCINCEGNCNGNSNYKGYDIVNNLQWFHGILSILHICQCQYQSSTASTQNSVNF